MNFNAFKVIHHHVILYKFPFRKLFTALIESSFRHVTERVIKRKQSFESRSAPRNKELLKKKLFLTVDFVYHPLKIALVIRWNKLLHKCFGLYRLYVMALYEYLAHVWLFTRSAQFVWH